MARILIAEDSPTQAAEIQLVLETAGYQVDVAPDGSKAIDALAASTYDLLVSDVVMPGLSGYELCRRVKIDPALKDMPVTLLTSLSDPMNIIQGLECGADNFLTKPYEPAALVDRVRTILDNKALRKEGRLRVGAEVFFMGKKLVINSDKEQILDLLVGTFENILLANQRLQKSQDELRAANATIDDYAQRLEERVQTSETKYRRLLEQANDAVLLLDLSGAIVEANRRAEELLGLPAAEVVGRLFESFAVTGELAHALVPHLLAKGSARTDNLYLARASGGWTCVDCSASLVEVGGEQLALVIAHDITERNDREDALRRSEQALRETERRFQAFMDNNPAVAFMKDEEGCFVYVNQPMRRKFPEITEWVGRTTEELFPQHAGQYRTNDLAVMQTGRSQVAEEQSPGPDGSVLDWLTLKFPFEEDGGRRFLGGVGLDVTERRQAEQALRRTEERLQQAQKMEAVGRLAGGVAHDFNNLLTVMIGHSELLLRASSTDASARESVEEIRLAAERAAALTGQLLAFSRKQILAPRTLSLNAVVGDMEKMLRRLIGEDVQLTVVLDPLARSVKADPSQIEQILMNLAVNARDAMPRGGKLTIETANAVLDEIYARSHPGVLPGRYSMVTVSDTGSGMDAETQARIFEPFFTTKEQGHGTGLGLATVYGIVQQSGGHVNVYSELGRGATFKVYLPSIEGTAPSGKSFAGTSTMSSGTETILLVEDEESLRTLGRHVLEICGYTVLAAADGQEAIAVCGRHAEPIHLLVSDVIMPHLGGRELAERLAVVKPEMKVLFVSGYTDDVVVRHGILDAKTAFLQKPYTPGDLARKVRDVLDAPR